MDVAQEHCTQPRTNRVSRLVLGNSGNIGGSIRLYTKRRTATSLSTLLSSSCQAIDGQWCLELEAELADQTYGFHVR